MKEAKRIASALSPSEAKLWTHAVKMMATPGDVIAAPRTMHFYQCHGLVQTLESGAYAPTALGQAVAAILEKRGT